MVCIEVPVELVESYRCTVKFSAGFAELPSSHEASGISQVPGSGQTDGRSDDVGDTTCAGQTRTIMCCSVVDHGGMIADDRACARNGVDGKRQRIAQVVGG